jgi:hypothetical protein
VRGQFLRKAPAHRVNAGMVSARASRKDGRQGQPGGQHMTLLRSDVELFRGGLHLAQLEQRTAQPVSRLRVRGLKRQARLKGAPGQGILAVGNVLVSRGQMVW